MPTPQFSMQELLDASVHFGHRTQRWNPKMKTFIYGERNGVHIIDLRKTMALLYEAMNLVTEIVAAGGRVIFVGTRPHAAPIVEDAARRCGQYFVNHRWLGGMITNWKTVAQSISRLKKYEEILADTQSGRPKKEILSISRNVEKLQRVLGGIRDLNTTPKCLIVLDVAKDRIALEEARKKGIPVIGIVDTNSNPEGVDYPIPGNDDSIQAVELYCNLFVQAVLEGVQKSLENVGIDVGEAAEGDLARSPQEKDSEQTVAPAAKTAATSPSEDAAAVEAPVAHLPWEESPPATQKA